MLDGHRRPRFRHPGHCRVAPRRESEQIGTSYSPRCQQCGSLTSDATHASYQPAEASEMFEEFSEWNRMDYIDPRLIVTKPDLAVLLPEPVALSTTSFRRGWKDGACRFGSATRTTIW